MCAARRPLATPPEVAEYLQVNESLLRDWRYRGEGPRWTKVGHQVRYDWQHIDAWLEGGTSKDAASSLVSRSR